MNARQQSNSTYEIVFFVNLSSDHVTAATGKTVTVTLRKTGGGTSFTAASGSVTEIGNGWYQLAANATDRNTLGDLIIHGTAAACDPVDFKVVILAQDPFATYVNADTKRINGATITGDGNAVPWDGA